MSTGYLILFYKNSMIESYIRNFLMTKYISLNNAIGSNILISKIKYYHRNYFCFINKEKNSVRCIIKLSKITNYQINLEIKSQQEISLLDLKSSETFLNESKIIDNFFNLENNNNTNYINNKINLLIKESNNIYEFNCILLENSFDMGIFEKIKRCMKDKENNHNNEIQNNLRNNTFISNILFYQAAFRKKNQENNNKGMNSISGNTINSTNTKDGDDKSNNKEMMYFDMKYDKYFLYDELLIDKNENNDNFFPKTQLQNYNELIDKYREIFKIADTISKKPFSELDDFKDEINFDNNGSSSVIINSKKNYNEPDNLNNQNLNDYKNKDDKKINYEINNNLKSMNNNDNVINKSFYYNSNSNSGNMNKIINNISVIKDDIRDNEFTDKNIYRKNNDLYINNYKKEIGNNIPYNNYMNNNYNTRDYNNNYKFYNSNNDNNNVKYNNRNNGGNPKKNNEKQYKDSNQTRNNSFNNNNQINKVNQNSNYINNNRNDRNERNERNDRNDNYLNNSRNDDNIRNYSNNNYNYNSSNNSSFTSDRGRNYSRSREKSPISSPNNNSMRYNSPPQKKYDKYERYNDRNNNSNKTNNYYGNNNNINYYYNIKNYYRPGSINRWNDNNYRHQGGNYQRDNYQQNKNDNYNNNNNNYYNSNNYEGHYNRERRRGSQNNNY